MFEEKDDKKLTSKKTTFAPVAFGSKVFSPAQPKMSIYCKEFQAINHAFIEYSHILWEAALPTLVMTDNQSVTKFFQTKAIPPTLWNACDCVLQFNFRIMHVAGTLNTAADFLSRLEVTPKENIKLTIREDVRTTPIQINMQSTDVADDEQQFFFPDEQLETEEEILQRKQTAKQQAQIAKQNEITATIQEATMIPINKLSYSLGAPNENPRIRNEQDTDTILKAIKAKLLQEEYDMHLLQTDRKAQKLLKHEKRITLKDGIIVRKYYGECCQVPHNQIVLPTHIIPELLRTLHGNSGKHPGITQMIQQCRRKYYFPDLASHIKQWALRTRYKI